MTNATRADAALEGQVFALVARNIAEFMPGVEAVQIRLDGGRLADYGCNSIDRMDIVWKTLDDLRLDIPVVEFASVHDLRSLVDLLCRFLAER